MHTDLCLDMHATGLCMHAAYRFMACQHLVGVKPAGNTNIRLGVNACRLSPSGCTAAIAGRSMQYRHLCCAHSIDYQHLQLQCALLVQRSTACSSPALSRPDNQQSMLWQLATVEHLLGADEQHACLPATLPLIQRPLQAPAAKQLTQQLCHVSASVLRCSLPFVARRRCSPMRVMAWD